MSRPLLTLALNIAYQWCHELQFGELQVAVMAESEKANTAAVIGIVFRILSWAVSQGIQSIPESSKQ
ncbi:hypothetical protein Ancab_000371 [Ancistrocladus abbreviatus]